MQRTFSLSALFSGTTASLIIHMESGEKSFDSFRNLVIILVVLCYTVIHSMSLRWYVVSEQFNYTKNRVFHAILLPVFIEFSRCIGTYSSAKFE